MDYERITDPAELAEAHKAFAFVKELKDSELLHEHIEPEDLALVRTIIERARADAVRDALATKPAPPVPA